jgi:hypothetical protein
MHQYSLILLSFMDFDLEQMERENITPIRQQQLSSPASTDLTLTS